jgi:hypothetical protein
MSKPPCTHLTPLVPDQSDDHRVEVEEEHQKVETKLDERLLLVHVELPEDLRGIEQVLVLEDPVIELVFARPYCQSRYSRAGTRGMYVLLRVPGQEGQVKDKRHPVAVDQEQDGQESVDTGLGDDVHVQAVAEIDRVDVVAFQVRVHDREKHLQEEVDGIEQDREEEQPASVLAGAQWYTVCGMFGAVVPSFSGHIGGICGVMIEG